MILDSTLKLEIVLAGAKTTNDMDVTVNYIAWTVEGLPTKPATFRVASNGSTDVTILAAPITVGMILEPISIHVYNRDTAGGTVTIKTDDGTTERTIIKKTLGSGESLQYNKAIGWFKEAVV